MTSLLLVTLVLLSITSDTAEGKRRDVKKMGEDQSLGAQTGKGGPGKAKLKLKKRKEKRRKTKSKKVKAGKKEQKSKGGKGKHRKIKGKGTKSKKSKSKDKKKKKKKKNDTRKLGKEEEKTEIEEKESIETARQVNTTVTEVNITETEDPDRYKHCDYLDLVEVGYREDSICKPGDKMVFKVNYLVAVKDFDGTHTGRKGNPKAVPYDTADKCCRLSRAGEESDILQ